MSAVMDGPADVHATTRPPYLIAFLIRSNETSHNSALATGELEDAGFQVAAKWAPLFYNS